MTLAERLLPRLNDWKPAGDGRHSTSEAFPEAGWTVQIAADKADSSRANRSYLRNRSIKALIPKKKDQAANRKKKGRRGGRPPACRTNTGSAAWPRWLRGTAHGRLDQAPAR